MSALWVQPSARRRLGVLVGGAALLAAFALASTWARSRTVAQPAGSRPEITLNPRNTTIEVSGLPQGTLVALRRQSLSPDGWTALFCVTVASEEGTVGTNDPSVPAVVGSYAVTDSAIVFTPMFGLDPGLRYRAIFDPARLPSSPALASSQPIVAWLTRPKPAFTATTVVDHVYPTTDVIPENHLRFYIHFSAPMGMKGGLEYVHLVDDVGHQVVDPFLPLDTEFWNGDRTRFTMFVDPGRVKRGVMPNEQMGRSLTAGHAYTLVVDRQWLDERGMPLKETFERSFRVGPADVSPLDVSTWRLQPPSPASHDPLVVTFPKPLDHGLLSRALGVATAGGGNVAGETRIEEAETRWIFTPREPWAAGDYRLIVLSILEDLAGNRIGRAFELDRFDRANQRAEPDAFTLPFRVESHSTR